MVYDEQLASWYRKNLKCKKNISEKRMMGGVCFFVNGNMIGGADRSKDGHGRYLFRLGVENQALGESLPGAEPMVQGGRSMRGFFFVEENSCEDSDRLQWLDHAFAHAKSLPPK